MQSYSEQRASERTHSSETIRITYDDNYGAHNLSVQVVDISATGIGLTTDTQLAKGQVIQFGKGHPNWSLPDQGIIVWSMRQKNGYRMGLEFIM